MIWVAMQARQRLVISAHWVMLLGVVVAITLATGAQAGPRTFPGVNGSIVFVSTRDGNAEVYRMNADGSGQTRLTNHPASDALPTANRGGSKITFTSNRDGNAEIYVMNADGSGVTRLTNHAAVDAGSVFSPDGSRIAFLSNRDGSPGLQIYVMNADGSGVTRVTNAPPDHFEPAWAPGGNAIAFSWRQGGNTDVYHVRPDGTGLVRLTENAAMDFAPDYSPDGRQLMFSSNRGGPFEIYVLNLPAGLSLRLGKAGLDDNPRKVTNRPSERKSHGRHSPNGMRMVFEGQPAGRSDFQVIEKAIGSDPERVLTGAGSNHQPFWVPLPQPCKCSSLTADILPTLLKNNRLQPDRHDFGIGFKWTIRCTAGTGAKCTGVIRVSAPQVFVDKIKQPKGALKIAANSFQFACNGPCAGANSKIVTVKMRSRDQLTKLIGQEFAFQLDTFCSGAQTVYRVRVLVDSKGRMTARVTKTRKRK